MHNQNLTPVEGFYSEILHLYITWSREVPSLSTYLRLDNFQKEIICQTITWLPEELPILVLWLYDDNWSMISTHRLICLKSKVLHTIALDDLELIDIDIPLFWVDIYVAEIFIHSKNQTFTLEVPNQKPYEFISFWTLLREIRTLKSKTGKF